MLIEVPISVGELFDKISILEIKLEEISNTDRRKHVERELAALTSVVNAHDLASFLNSDLYLKLKDINKLLWDVCDIRRKFESENRFDKEFIAQSRHEYLTNDRRAKVKAEINQFFNSDIYEVKSYNNSDL
jgi:hypothetical protein